MGIDADSEAKVSKYIHSSFIHPTIWRLNLKYILNLKELFKLYKYFQLIGTQSFVPQQMQKVFESKKH